MGVRSKGIDVRRELKPTSSLFWRTQQKCTRNWVGVITGIGRDVFSVAEPMPCSIGLGMPFVERSFNE